MKEFDRYISEGIYACLRKSPSLLKYGDMRFLWEYAKERLFEQNQKSMQGLTDAEKERFLNLLFDAKEENEGWQAQDYSGCVAWCIRLLHAYHDHEAEA